MRSISKTEFEERAKETGDAFAQVFCQRATEFKLWPAYGSEQGAVCFTTDNNVCNLKLLHVFSDFERRGFGSLLLNYVIEQGVGCDYFKVSVEPDAVGFYEKNGFVLLGEELNYHSQLSIMKYCDGELEYVEDEGFYEIKKRYPLKNG